MEDPRIISALFIFLKMAYYNVLINIVDCLDEFISHYGTLEEVMEHKDDIYFYPDCDTMTDVAYYYIDELQALGDIPTSLQNYIDYEAFGRDLDIGGCFIETSYGMCEIPY